MNRRSFVAAAATGSVAATAGCLGSLLEDATTFTASPTRVGEGADDAGYEYHHTLELTESHEVGGETVEVTNYATEYTRTIDAPLEEVGGSVEAGVFAVITTPQVSVAGQEFNPVARLSTAEVVEMVQGQYEGFSVDDGAVDERSADGLEGSVDLETYEGEARLQGDHAVDVFVDVARPDHGDDHFVITAIHPDWPAIDPSGERDRVDTMIGGLEHGDDLDVQLEEG